METTFGWFSILPPVLAIGMAIATRQVTLSLVAGIWLGGVIQAGWNPLAGTGTAVTAIIDVFVDAGQTRVVVFTMLMGSLLILMQRSGGIDGFLAWIGRWTWSQSRRGAQLMASIIGLGVFIESTITCLVVGTVSRPLFDRLKISREKLAYICDSTSAPVCMLIPFNGWGATVLGLLGAQAALGNLGDSGPLAVFVAAVPLNFYSIAAVVLVFIVSATGWHIGPMKEAERRAAEEGKVLRDGARPVVDDEVIMTPRKPEARPRLDNMMVPLVAMVLMVFAGIAITGRAGVSAAGLENPGLMDYLNQASGSTSVLWAVLLALALMAVMSLSQGIFTVQEYVDLSFKGAGGMLPLAALLVLALALGATCSALGTGPWVAQQVQPFLTPALVAPLVFLVTGFIAFATGSSWGTFAIMMPLAVPLAATFNAEAVVVSVPLVVSAVLGGGVFGDHCSPISDTSVVSSMAAASDHIDHVRTQLPYALVAGGAAFVVYLVVGVV
ncbi:MAG: Na+/H+ antiporter NhaC family protein [Vicinamibacterales bacterium]|nr:Na+/H+ antiporter NhaC family protein [Vicinamibacterales bacterium]MDP7670346.1 Na+/H+ antiporter NhaC family protein [Vicinamibacterales bacterium]HJO38003.1 Na+/H+ antiporter NhaC family protein [Vicinamibacterales bacterium]